MNDLVEALKVRLSSPILGYFGLAFAAINWKPLFYVAAHDGGVLDRIQFVEQNTSWLSALVWPLASSLLVALAHPWIVYALASLTAKAVEMKDMLQVRSEHNLIVARTRLEEERSRMLASAEMDLIGRAERDVKVNQLEDEEVRNRIRKELEELRAARDALSREGEASSWFRRHQELMDSAKTYREIARESVDASDRDDLLDKARELEDQAYQMARKASSRGI